MTGETLVSGFGRMVPSAMGDNNTGDYTLGWYCAPDAWPTVDSPSAEGYGGRWQITDNNKLELYPPSQKDFWRQTYYRPILVKDDGPVLCTELTADDDVYTITTSFTLYAHRQFDQAGLCVRLDAQHWIKSGIEVVDGRARLSCVVTNVYSDWSTQPWTPQQTTAGSTLTEVVCTIRIHSFGQGNFVVESKQSDDDATWELVRICHLSQAHTCQPDPLAKHPTVQGAFCGPAPPVGHLWVGVFGCCPAEQPGDTKVVFDNFSVVQGSDFDHSAD